MPLQHFEQSVQLYRVLSGYFIFLTFACISKSAGTVVWQEGTGFWRSWAYSRKTSRLRPFDSYVIIICRRRQHWPNFPITTIYTSLAIILSHRLRLGNGKRRNNRWSRRGWAKFSIWTDWITAEVSGKRARLWVGEPLDSMTNLDSIHFMSVSRLWNRKHGTLQTESEDSKFKLWCRNYLGLGTYHETEESVFFFESRMIVPDSCDLFYIYFWGFCRGCQACVVDHTNCFGYCRENRCRWWEDACCHGWFCCHAFLSSILSEKTPSNHFEYSVLSGWYRNTLYVTIQISQPAHAVETTSSPSSWQAFPQVELGITSLVLEGMKNV